MTWVTTAGSGEGVGDDEWVVMIVDDAGLDA